MNPLVSAAPQSLPAGDTWPGRSVPEIRGPLPGPRARALIAADAAVSSPSLTRSYELVPVRGAGLVVEDADDNLFLDFAAGIAVSSTGHAHPAVVSAVQAQATQLLHFAGCDFFEPRYGELCARLAAISPISGPQRVFLANSGAEAIEAAIKLARYHTRRPNLIAFEGAFHGRTYGALSLTASKTRQRAGFGPFLPGVYHAPYGTAAGLEFIEQRLFAHVVDPREVAAIVVEPIQGEGGYIVPDDEFLPGLRRIADQHGILLVVDEIQSGAGRTGRMWAVEHWGVEPDLLVSAKGIASGLPLGALIGRAELFDWPAGAHGSTFGGNLLACVAALATIELLENGLVANAAAMGQRLLLGLTWLAGRHPSVVAVRGKGLMAALVLTSGEAAARLCTGAFRQGLLTLPVGGDALRLCPPLIVSSEQIDLAVALLEAALIEVDVDLA